MQHVWIVLLSTPDAEVDDLTICDDRLLAAAELVAQVEATCRLMCSEPEPVDLIMEDVRRALGVWIEEEGSAPFVWHINGYADLGDRECDQCWRLGRFPVKTRDAR